MDEGNIGLYSSKPGGPSIVNPSRFSETGGRRAPRAPPSVRPCSKLYIFCSIWNSIFWSVKLAAWLNTRTQNKPFLFLFESLAIYYSIDKEFECNIFIRRPVDYA